MDGWGACAGVLNPLDDDDETGLGWVVAPPAGWVGPEGDCGCPGDDCAGWLFEVCDAEPVVDGWLAWPGSALATVAETIPAASREPTAT